MCSTAVLPLLPIVPSHARHGTVIPWLSRHAASHKASLQCSTGSAIACVGAAYTNTASSSLGDKKKHRISQNFPNHLFYIADNTTGMHVPTLEYSTEEKWRQPSERQGSQGSQQWQANKSAVTVLVRTAEIVEGFTFPSMVSTGLPLLPPLVELAAAR